MRRREFILLVGGTAAVWSSRVHGQHPAIPTIGWLNLASDTAARPMSEAFRSGLAALGYTEGNNIRVLYRYADGHAERLSALASELVSLGALVIVTNGGSSIQAAHNAAPNIPIVSWVGPEPVMMGWAQSLAKPGGMITGLFFIGVFPKRLELLKECDRKRPRSAICSTPKILEIHNSGG